MDDYIEGLPAAQREVFERMSVIVKSHVPGVEQGVSYGMPTFMVKGQPLVSVIARTKHFSLYPFSGKVVDGLRDKLGGFSLSSGTIRFSENNPIPDGLLKDILDCRLAEIEGAKGS